MGAPEERDQASVVDAYKELNSYLSDYPDSKQSAHVRELLVAGGRAPRPPRALRRALLPGEGQLRRCGRAHPVRPPQLRARGAPRREPASRADSDLEAEALLLLGKTYLKMHKWADARQAFETIVSGHGQSPLVIQARDYLQHLSEQGA